MFSSFWAFAIFLFFWNTSPGPMTTLTSRYSVKYGLKGGALIIAGILICDIIYLVLAFLGVSTFITRNEKIFHYATILGGIYIFYIGVSIIIEASKSKKDFTSEEGVLAGFNMKKIFLRGFFTNLSSPITIVGMTSFILPFFKPEMTVLEKGFFAFLIPFSTLYCFLLVSFLFGNPVIRKLITPKMVWFERIAGAIICYMAVMVIFFG